MLSIKVNDAVLLYTEVNKTFLIRKGKTRPVERMISYTGFMTVVRQTNNFG